MQFKMIDGTVFSGDTFQDIVAAMASSKLTPTPSLRSYRRATAQRVLESYEQVLDTRTDEKFINSLVSVGLMERVK